LYLSVGCLSVYEYIRTSNPLPTVASRIANSCSNRGVPEIASGRTRTRVWRNGMPEFAQRQTPTQLLTIKCQVGLSFFYGRLTNILGHLGHECQQQGLKKCKFPGKLVEISRGPQVEDDRPFVTSQKKFIFLKTLHSRDLTITAHTEINLD